MSDVNCPSPWRPIAEAPKDGSEILGYRKDCGVVVMRWVCPDQFLSDREIQLAGLCEEDAMKSDWYYADFIHGGNMSNDGLPTHFMPLPSPPKDGGNL